MSQIISETHELEPRRLPTDIPTLKQIAARVANFTGAKQVIVFGSVARGDTNENSDLDLLLLLEDGTNLWDAALKAQDAFCPRYFPMDFVPMTLSQYKENNTPLAIVVAREGKVLYGEST
jgi:predicted nucleotidyltransferase